MPENSIMFGKTLWQIANLDDDIKFAATVEEFIRELKVEYDNAVKRESKDKSEDFTSDNVIMLLTELLPADIDRLEFITKRIDLMMDDYYLQAQENRKITPDQAFAISSLHTAANNKMNTLRGVTAPLHIWIKEEEQSKFFASQMDPATRDAKGRLPAEIIKNANKQIELLQRSLKLAEDLSTDTSKTKLTRFKNTLAAFHDLTYYVPDFVQVDIAKKLDNLGNSLRDIETMNDASPDIEIPILDAIQKLNGIILIMISSLHKKLTDIKSEISHSLYSQIDKEILRLSALGPTLMMSSTPDTHELIVDNFTLVYSSLSNQIKKAPFLPEEINHIKKEKSALALANNVLDEYQYQIPEISVRKSQNPFYKDQLKNNLTEVANENKYILIAKQHDNLPLIRADAERSLQISGQRVPGTAYRSNDEMMKYLVEHLGQENANALVRHYDQTVPFLLSGAVSASAGSNSNSDIDFNAGTSHTENIHVLNGAMIREAAIDKLSLYVPNDPNLDENIRWQIKLKTKIVSLGTRDGFSVTRIGTESAFMSNAIMQESIFDGFKKVVNQIISSETELLEKKNKFSREAGAHSKLVITGNALDLIKDFKLGKLTIEEFATAIDEVSKREIPHLGSVGKVRGFFTNKETGLKESLLTLADVLNSFTTELKKNAQQFRVQPEHQPASPRPT